MRLRQTAAWRWMARILLFHAVCLGWVFFRASSFAIAFVMLRRLRIPGAVTLATVPVVLALIAGLAGSSSRCAGVRASSARLAVAGHGPRRGFCGSDFRRRSCWALPE